MLRSNQEEQIKYFYLDRKFGSGSLREIGEALDEVHLCLPAMTNIDLINSLVMRMLDLIQTAKSFHIKHRVAVIFRHHSAMLQRIHSRDEIALVLSKCLKGSDEYTRIVAIQMIAALVSLFLKDIAVYHTLLSKIAATITSKQEKKDSIICLTQILSKSTQISKLLTKNITQIQMQYKIKLHILIYLLTYVTIDSHLQKQVLEDLLTLVTKNGLQANPKRKKEIYYFEKLVMKYAQANYRIVALYQSKLKTILPRLQNEIATIKSIKYPFMKNAYQYSKQVHETKLQVFLDELYQCKRQGNSLQQYQQKIKRLIIQALNQPPLFLQRILLINYLQQSCSKVDQQLFFMIELGQGSFNMTLLKKLLVVGLYKSSSLLLNKVQMHQSNYIFLQLYTQFKIMDSLSSLERLLEIAVILNQQYFKLLTLWKNISHILQIKSNCRDNQYDIPTLHNELSQTVISLKKNSMFTQQLQVASLIIHHKSHSIHQIKSKCYYLLPSNMLYNNSRFWFAYLHKQTILSLFRTPMII